MKMRYFKLLYIIAISFFNILDSAQVVPSKDTFSLLSWNILGPTAPDADDFLRVMVRYSDHQKRLEDVVYAIDSWDADIVCLQEVNQDTLIILGELLNNVLSNKYFLAAWSSKGKTGGVAILVKLDLVTDANKITLEQEAFYNLQNPGPIQHLGAAYAELEFEDGANVLVCSAHLSRANGRSNKSSADGINQLGYIVRNIQSFIANDVTLPVIIAGDFNTLYEEVLVTYMSTIQHFGKCPWEMYQHNSFTAGELDGYLSSIDHILYRCLNIKDEDSWVFGDLYLDDIKNIKNKVYAQHRDPDENDDARVEILNNAANSLKTYEIYLPEVTGKSFLMRNRSRLKNPSDHLPIYVIFEKGEIADDSLVNVIVDSQTIARALNLGRAVKEYSNEVVGRALHLSKAVMQLPINVGQQQPKRSPQQVQRLPKPKPQAKQQSLHVQQLPINAGQQQSKQSPQQAQQLPKPKPQAKQQLPKAPLHQEPNQPRSCSYTYKFADGTVFGGSHNDIERAGVLLVVPTGANSPDILENYGIIVGYDKNLHSWMVGQAGKIELSHRTTAETASAELLEETGGYMKLQPQQIVQLPYFYAGKKQMFIYKIDDINLCSHIKNSVRAAQLSNLPQSYKEINDVEVVSVKEFLNLLDIIDTAQLQIRAKGKPYLAVKRDVTSITGRKISELSYFYTTMFSFPGTNRYRKTQEMFRKLLGR